MLRDRNLNIGTGRYVQKYVKELSVKVNPEQEPDSLLLAVRVIVRVLRVPRRVVGVELSDHLHDPHQPRRLRVRVVEEGLVADLS